MPVPLTPAQLARDLAVTDLSEPADGPHAIHQGTRHQWALAPGPVPSRPH